MVVEYVCSFSSCKNHQEFPVIGHLIRSGVCNCVVSVVVHVFFHMLAFWGKVLPGQYVSETRVLTVADLCESDEQLQLLLIVKIQHLCLASSLRLEN